MGWWGVYYGGKAPNRKDRLQMILHQEELDKETEHGKLIDVSLVGTTVYGAYYNKRLDKVIGIVLLSHWCDGELRIKSMDETVGPTHVQCPMRILNKLSPLTPEDDPHGWCAKWREQCVAYNKQPKGELSKLPLYTRIRLHNPQKTILIIEPGYGGKGRRYVGYGCHASARCVNSWGYDVIEEENR